ncbi:hypothetical protein ECANGB1_2768 [Enterospora canceri]|uniref:Uncharacterized protein n=1 Tax=Enterospora canceri TaxID=1081671 RepID=A0A1Y1SAF3_9MICR|nr:hypothetical protein ECANGB1_2768 [Enterospora canceri]
MHRVKEKLPNPRRLVHFSPEKSHNFYPTMFLEFLKVSGIFVTIVAAVIGVCIVTIRSIEYIEENTYAAKEKIVKIIYFTMACYIFFMLKGMSFLHLLLGLGIQYTFNILMHTYPAIKPEDPKFIGAVLGSLVNHFLMIKFFFDKSGSIFMIVFAFVIVWLTPFCMFFSMSATDDVLFVKNPNKPLKTYAGMFLDWLLHISKKRRERMQ